MEDFIERVGQSYLERKAFALPQQLENLAKKQLSGGGEEEAKAKKSTGKATEEEDEGEEEEKRTTKNKGSAKSADQTSLGSSGKDKEIARLKKQLAQSKPESPKASSGKSASGPKLSGVSRASNGQKAFMSKAAKGEKETKKLATLGAIGAGGARHEEKKSNTGEKESSASRLAKEANIIEISPTKRKMSTSQHNEHDDGAKSEHEDGGHAKSTPPHATAKSKGKRRPSTASQSEHGNMAKSIASAPSHKHLPAHAQRPQEERAIVESRHSRWQHEQDRDLYAIEVEEEVPRRRRKDAGGVVEVESSTGRTLYRV